MKSIIGCIILTLILGTAIDLVVVEPVLETIRSTFPCPSNLQANQACNGVELVLYVIPYIGSFLGIMRFLQKIGIINDYEFS